MKLLFNKNYLIAIFFIGIASYSYAQKNFSDLANMNDRKWDKMVKSVKKNNSYTSLIKGLVNIKVLEKENLPNPKKIGILSFQLWDESITKSRKSGNWRYYEKHFLTGNGSNVVSNKLLSIMLPTMQEQFKDKGMNLIEPKEFADTDDKKVVYDNGASTIELGGILKFFSNGLFNRLQGNREGQGSTSADGYAFYPITAKIIASDYKSPAQIGLIAEQLGLDAVLIVAANVSIEKGGKALFFRGLETVLVGPVNDDTSIEYKGRIGAGMMNKYRDGIVFSTAYFANEPFQLAKMKRKTGEIEDWYIKDLDQVTNRLTNDLLLGLDKFKEQNNKL